MIINTTKEEFFSTNKHFDQLYPLQIRRLSYLHWTPIEIAQQAAAFLGAVPGASILDIGAGVGKFCLNAGYHAPDCNFYGVEQRSSLVDIANQVQQDLGLTNTSFIHGDFTQLDFSAFDHFYFYNPFYENLVDESLYIDNTIAHSESLYEYYAGFLYNLLDTRPAGTRLATYQSSHTRIPAAYQMVKCDVNTLFSCWIKMI
mgnify:CR=1 FL=1